MGYLKVNITKYFSLKITIIFMLHIFLSTSVYSDFFKDLSKNLDQSVFSAKIKNNKITGLENIEQAKKQSINSLKVDYLAGDIDKNIVETLKLINSKNYLKLKTSKIEKSGDICGLLKREGLYQVNCTAELSNFISEINNGTRNFTKGMSINLPVLNTKIDSFEQLTRASTFLKKNQTKINKNNLASKLEINNYILPTPKNYKISDKILAKNRSRIRKSIESTDLIRVPIDKLTIDYSINENAISFHEIGEVVNAKVFESANVLASAVSLSTNDSSVTLQVNANAEFKSLNENNISAYWNSWVWKNAKRKVINTSHLEPNIDNYKLTIQLSGYKYNNNSIISENVSTQFRESFQKLCDEEYETNEEIIIIAISGNENIQFSEDQKKETINLKKLCSFKFNGNETIKVTDLRAFTENTENVDFIFTDISFAFKTKDKKGTFPVAFSIWYRNKPIDEIVLNLCVGDNDSNCESAYTNTKASISHLKKSEDINRVASFHFFGFSDRSFNSDDVVALFWDHKNQNEIHTWLIKRANIVAVTESILKDFELNFPNYEQLSESLFDLIFPNQNIANKYFSAVSVKDKKPFSYINEEKTPEIYVRSRNTKIANLDGIPIGLLPATKDLTNQPESLLGVHYRIHQPLDFELSTDSCISSKGLMFPNSNTADPNDEAIKTAIKISQTPSFKSFKDNSTIIENPEGLTSWSDINQKGQGLFAFLGHFGKRGLGFKSYETDLVDSGNFFGKVKSPSVAVINACGTGVRDGFKFVQDLNNMNFHSIIATNSNITGFFGQSYFNCFSDQLHNANKPQIIGNIHSKALRCLYKTPKPDYHPDTGDARNFKSDVLRYSLFGAHDVKVCN